MLGYYAESSFKIVGSDILPNALEKDEEEKLLEKFDEESKRILIEKNLRLVILIAKKFESDEETLEDLTSIGTIGLIKAINTFDRSKKRKLSTYASKCILNEILMYFRNLGKQSPKYCIYSLQDVISVDENGNSLLFDDMLYDERNNIEFLENIETLKKSFKNLTDKEKKVIKMRYYQDLSQKDIANILGISQSYVSRIETKAIKYLRQDFI